MGTPQSRRAASPWSWLVARFWPTCVGHSVISILESPSVREMMVVGTTPLRLVGAALVIAARAALAMGGGGWSPKAPPQARQADGVTRNA